MRENTFHVKLFVIIITEETNSLTTIGHLCDSPLGFIQVLIGVSSTI